MSISIKDALKLLVLILVPVNTWLVILYYINRSKATVLYPSIRQNEKSSPLKTPWSISWKASRKFKSIPLSA